MSINSFPIFDHENRDELEFEFLKSQANQPGRLWSTIFRNRMLSDSNVKKFVSGQLQRDRYEGSDPEFDRMEDEHILNIQKVTSYTNYAKAEEFRDEYGEEMIPQMKGKGKFSENPTVFSDAVDQMGNELSVDQKGIIEAHELAHAVLDKITDAQRDFLLSLVNDYYLSLSNNKRITAQEMIARMSQLKDYFGIQNGDEFTPLHLRYLISNSNYIKDTGLDNSVGLLLRSIKDGKEQDFVRAMNIIAC